MQPKLKPMDHFDVMTDFDQKTYWDDEAAKKAMNVQKRAAYRAGLDRQLMEKRDALDREAELARFERERIQANVDAFEKEKSTEAETKRQLKDDAKLKAGDITELLARRQRREEDKVRRESAEMKKTLEHENEQLINQVLGKQAVFETRCKENKAYLERTNAERAKRREEQVVHERSVVAEAQRVMDAADAEKAATIQNRQDKVDRVNSSMGNALVEQRMKEEREAEERQRRSEDEYNRKRVEQYWKEHNEHERKLQATMQVNDTQLWHKAKWKDSDPEKKEELRQLEMNRRAEEEEGSEKRSKLLRLRRLREEMDESLMETIHKNSSVHRSEIGISPKQKKNEISYNRPFLERVHSESFALGLTGTMLQRA